MSTPENREGEQPPPLVNTVPPSSKTPCRDCGRGIDLQDLYCRFCGGRQVATDPLYYHPVVILLLALVVLGPFALILLWRARAMRRDVKIVLAVIIVVYSIATLYYSYVFGMAVYRHFSEVLRVM